MGDVSSGDQLVMLVAQVEAEPALQPHRVAVLALAAGQRVAVPGCGSGHEGLALVQAVGPLKSALARQMMFGRR